MSRRINHLIAAIAIIALWSPLAARALGKHASVVENRNLLQAPRLDAGWSFFKELGPYINDHLPLRQRAIRADAWIDAHVFREDPSFGGNGSPRVISGLGGFLFINDAFTDACAPHLPPREVADHLARLASIIETSGRKIVTAVAPDKSSVLPQFLPKNMVLRKCFDEYTYVLWSSLRDAQIPGFIDLRTALMDAASSTRQPLYFRKDTHWDPAGSLVAVEKIIRSLAPGLWNKNQVSYDGLFNYDGDLTDLRGIPESDEAPAFSVNRQGVSVVKTEHAAGYDDGGNLRTIRTGPKDSMIQGRTLFLLDSFGMAALPQLGPFFEDLTTVSLNDFDPDKYTKLIDDADTVIILSVERSTGWRMLDAVGSDSFLKLLSRSLKGH